MEQVPGEIDISPEGVVVRDVWRSFGSVQALSGMSLTAPYGQVTALVDNVLAECRG